MKDFIKKIFNIKPEYIKNPDYRGRNVLFRYFLGSHAGITTSNPFVNVSLCNNHDRGIEIVVYELQKKKNKKQD